MKIGFYVARMFAVTTLLTLSVLVVLVVSATLMESVGNTAHIDNTGMVALKLTLFASLEYAYQLLPVACFLGAIAAGTFLGRHGELLALSTSGVSIRRQMVPGLVVGIVAVVAGLALGEFAVPWAMQKTEQIHLDSRGSYSRLTRFFNEPNQWYRQGDRIYYLPLLDAATEAVSNPVVYRFDGDMVTGVLSGEKLSFRDGIWVMEGARAFNTEGLGVVHEQAVPVQLSTEPRDLFDIVGNPQHMRWRELTGLVSRREAAGIDATPYVIERQLRLAFPLSTLTLLLLVLPWALRPERNRSLAAGLGGGVIAIAVLLSAMNIFRMLALGRDIPAFLGAWGPPIFCVVLLPINYWFYARKR